MLMDISPSMLEVEAYQLVMEYGLEDAILRLSSNDPATSSAETESCDNMSLAAMLSQYARSVTKEIPLDGSASIYPSVSYSTTKFQRSRFLSTFAAL